MMRLILLLVISVASYAQPRGATNNKQLRHTKIRRQLMTMMEGSSSSDTDTPAPTSPPTSPPSAQIITEPDQDAAELCLLFKAFDTVLRHNNDKSLPGLPWTQFCEDFNVADDILCPGTDALAGICSYNNPENNRAVKEAYCEPLFADLEDVSNDTDDPPLKGDCVSYCVNYVSKARADCCDLNCN
jgi:hypothetical protein